MTRRPPIRRFLDDGLAGRIAIVTGGARGIGAAIALDLAAQGAHIAVLDQARFPSTVPLLKKIKSLGVDCLALQVDVADTRETEQATQTVAKAFGRIDILVNNAGINRDAVVWKMTEEQWDSVIATNLKGCFNLCRAVIPVMRKCGRGRIVNIASINGLRGKFGQSNYAASKAGVIGLTKSLARELGAFHITVNAVAPGFIHTDMTRALPDPVLAKALEETALGTLGEPEDVAHAVTFLCSERARHITGVVLKVDGGQYI